MNFIVTSFFFLTFSTTLIKSDPTQSDATIKNVPKSTPTQAVEPYFDIKEACKGNNNVQSACEATIKVAVGDNTNLKISEVVEMLVRYAQALYGATTSDVRTQMRDDLMPKPTKIALSHCLKMYLDMADVQRGLYLAVRSKKYEAPEATTFVRMAHSLMKFCEEGLNKVGTTGKKLDIYEDYMELDNVATTIETVLRYASQKKAGGN